MARTVAGITDLLRTGDLAATSYPNPMGELIELGRYQTLKHLVGNWGAGLLKKDKRGATTSQKYGLCNHYSCLCDNIP